MKQKLEQRLEQASNKIKELNEKMADGGLTHEEIQLLQHYRRQYHHIEDIYLTYQRKKTQKLHRMIILPDDYTDWIRRYNSIGGANE